MTYLDLLSRLFVLLPLLALVLALVLLDDDDDDHGGGRMISVTTATVWRVLV
jgi:hypothetical protein